jgi:hypothetical protein
VSPPFRKTNAWRKGFERSPTLPRWPGLGKQRVDTPWGRCITAFDTIIDHANTVPSAHILLAASTSLSFSNMHMACEYYLPQAAALRKGGIWHFPNGARLRVSRVSSEADADKLADHDFSLISVQAEGEVVALLQPMLTLQGRIIPFLGYY